MIFTPHDYQQEITDHQISTPRGAQWAAMGSGKTASTLRTLDTLSLLDSKPALVLAPLRVARSTWPDEIAKWDNIAGEVVSLAGSGAQPASAAVRHHLLFKALKNGNASVLTLNYDNIEWLVHTLADAKAGWPFSTIVADEATRLKSFRLRQGGKRARALAQVAYRSERFIELTGTPAPNGLKDLWGPLWFLDKGERLGRTHAAFADRWFRTGYSGFGMEPMPHAQGEIQERIGDICRTIKPNLDVREPVYNTIKVELPAKARKTYYKMEKAMYAEIGLHGVEAFSAGAKSMKCRQIANGMVYVTDDEGPDRLVEEVHDVKIQALESVIAEACGAPVLIAYHFKPELKRLLKHFPQGRELDTDPATIRDWNAGKIPLLFAHPASAGHGINLQDGGNIVCFLNLDWNLELHDQIMERIGPLRQKQAGHDRPVYIHVILANDTIDEELIERLHSKRSVQDILLEAMRRKG